MANIVEETIALRDRAWAEVEATPQYKAFLILKNAVDLIAPPPVIGIPRSIPLSVAGEAPSSAVGRILNEAAGRRVPQAQAAFIALTKLAKPTPASELLERAIREGAVVGGEKPLVSFTSTLSKDVRFQSIRKAGTYYWWFANRPLPENWNEADSDDSESLVESASSSSSQEGGDGHGPATT